MVHPTVKSRAMRDTMANPATAANRMQDIWIWEGRPDWDLLFPQVRGGSYEDGRVTSTIVGFLGNCRTGERSPSKLNPACRPACRLWC